MLRSHIYLLLMVPSKIQSSCLLFILTLRASSSAAASNVLSWVAAVLQWQGGRHECSAAFLEVLGGWWQLQCCGYPQSGVQSVPVVCLFVFF